MNTKTKTGSLTLSQVGYALIGYRTIDLCVPCRTHVTPPAYIPERALLVKIKGLFS
jgi:hypothetical protein